jgi:hypothetical protein
MLKHSFSEGTSLQSTGKVEIPLPEDDSNLFEVLLNILHYRHRAVPETIALREFVKFAILVDKYQISLETIEIHTTRWMAALKPGIPDDIEAGVEDWICIAWVFRLSDVFRDMTRLRIMQSKNILSDDLVKDMIMPASIARKSCSTLYHLN